jgi:hypothetical protein
MSETTQIVEQAIAKQEAEEAGVDTGKKDEDKGKDDDKDTGTAGKSGAGADDSKAGDKDTADDSKKTDDDKKADDREEEGKFTADDALEVDAPKETPTPTDNSGVQLSPPEQKHIADNIGEPLVIRGIRGEGDNAKEVEIKAYSAQDIPSDFKFANQQQLLAAQNGFQRLEQKAADLLGGYRQSQNQNVQQEFETRENEGIKLDVADLQKEGIEINGETVKFPKFRVQPGAAGFDDTPEAKQMAEVLTLMADKNATYLAQYNQGRPYKHIGFSEAFDIWVRNNPDKKAEQKANEGQKKEDEERKKTGEHSNSNRGMSTSNLVKPTVKAGTTTRDILNRIEAEEE